MQYTLSNDNFEVIVDSKGCEIVSVIERAIISSIYGLDSQTYGKDIHQYYSRWLEGIRTILQYTREKNII